MSLPNDIPSLMQRASQAFRSGDLAAAENLTRNALQLNPQRPDIHSSLGIILKKQNRLDEARRCFDQALSLNPSHVTTLTELGTLLLQQDQLLPGTALLEKAFALKPDNINTLNNLGIAYQRLDRLDDSLRCYRQAMALNGSIAAMPNNIGLILTDLGRIDEAIASFEQALSIAPNYIQALNNLAAAYSRIGRMNDAINVFHTMLRIDPSRGDYAGNLLMTYHYRHIDPRELFQHHLDWAARYTHSIPPITLRIDPDPHRRLRIGYISPDFRNHSVSYFVEAVLAHHDRNHFHVTVYTDVDRRLSRERYLESLADESHNIAGLSDQAVAEMIASHKIDILVELAGHSAKNHLLVCARKPAPVLITWIGYPDTTGLSQIDYRITDAIADPPGVTDQFHSEKLLRLPRGFLLYAAPKDAPDVSTPPFLRNNYITFGSFNNFSKLSPETLQLWARVLQAVPDSHLLLKSRVLANASTREQTLAYFNERNVNNARITLLPWEKDATSHLSRYRDIDLALDPFPYNGTTTTCESLYMGVPVIALLGQAHHARVSASLLTTIGLPQFIAKDADEYIQIAARAAADREGLKTLRADLRSILGSCSLMDPKQFMPDYEAALRRIWIERVESLPQ